MIIALGPKTGPVTKSLQVVANQRKVARASKPAVSPISKSAGGRSLLAPRRLETCDTADLEICATTLSVAVGPKRRGGRPHYVLWLGRGALAASLWMGLRLAAGAQAPTNAPPAEGSAVTNAPPAKTAAATNAPPAKSQEPASKPEGSAAPLTPEQMFEGGTNVFKNWIEFGAGGFMVKGDAAQAEQQQQLKRGAYGGIEDLHFEGNIDKKTTLVLDGHGIFDDHDYQLGLNIKREDTGYLKLNFDNFHTWSDSSGGFFAPGNLHFSTSGEGLPLDRGNVSVEAGLALKNAPKITFKYTHQYRDGNESSTIWGPTPTSLGTRNLFPGSYNLDEKSDSFALEVTHSLAGMNLGGGVRYDTGTMDNALLTTSQPGEPDNRITDRQGTDYDMFSVHAFAESWLKKDLFLSAGLVFDNLGSTYSGSQVYGSEFNVAFTPNTLSGLGYYALGGGSQMREYIFNLNLLAVPAKALTIIPSVRVDKADWSADSSGIGTLGAFPTEPFTSRSDLDQLDVLERVDLRYNGFTNWTLYAAPEWTEGTGNLKENGGLSQVFSLGLPPIQYASDQSRFFQKYLAGVRWYPTRRLTLDAGGYYKYDKYNYTATLDSTPGAYPGFLVMQGFETYDANLRLTFRPLQNVTLVGRYDHQLSNVHTGPTPDSGLSETESARMTSHIVGLNGSWVPWSRLSLQLGFNYVLSDVRTPASDYTAAVLKTENDYWTMNVNTSFVVDNKTDLNLGYFYYQPDNAQYNYSRGLPLGAAAQEHGVTAGLTRRLTSHWRWNLRYAFTHFEDFASGGFNNFQAQLLYSSLQYRF